MKFLSSFSSSGLIRGEWRFPIQNMRENINFNSHMTSARVAGDANAMLSTKQECPAPIW